MRTFKIILSYLVGFFGGIFTLAGYTTGSIQTAIIAISTSLLLFIFLIVFHIKDSKKGRKKYYDRFKSQSTLKTYC